VSMPEEYGFDYPSFDRGAGEGDTLAKWYVPGMYTSTASVIAGRTLVYRYDTGGLIMGGRQRLTAGQQITWEQTISSRERVPESSVAKRDKIDEKDIELSVVFVKVNGDVRIRRRKGAAWIKAAPGMKLSAGEVLATYEGTAALRIERADFSTLVDLEENSKLAVNGFYPAEEKKGEWTMIELAVGAMKVETKVPGVEPPELYVKSPAFLLQLDEGAVYVSSYGSENVYMKWYAPGLYRTNVNVFEGKVAVAPYDEYGPRYDKGELLVGGKSFSMESKVETE